MGDMKRLALAAGLLFAGPVWAGDFPYRGQWETRFPDASYMAIVLIDGERRVTVDSPKDQGRPAKYMGYIADATDKRLVIHLTDRAGVVKTYCDIRTLDLLHCYNIRAAGSRSDNFLMVKVGPGPHRLTQRGQ